MTRATLASAVCLPAVLCAAWTVFAGKDVNWDLLNYHYYLPYELLDSRIAQDFFAASAQSYLNPLGYLPFYLFVAAGWHSVAASILLALVHGASLTLLFVLGWKLFAHLPSRERLVFATLGAALGAATWVFWPTVGSSFLDPLLAPLVLGGLVLLLQGGTRRGALAGAFFGAAAALKYSNTIYVIAALPLALAARNGVAFGAGAVVAVAALAGPWLVMLAREFGNPVFPLMNAWFQSPHAPAVNLVGTRFSPQGFLDALAMPFRMAALDRHLYSEIFAPDLRPAALLVLAIAMPLARRREGRLAAADWAALAFVATAWVLWVATSANARYGMVVLLLAGLLLARLAERLFPQRIAHIALALLLALQVATSLVASPTRWFIAEPWSTRWLPYHAPERAVRAPALYLSVEVLPMAVVVPFLHPASSFVNFRGQHSLPADAPRLLALLERHRGKVRSLGRRPPSDAKFYDDALRQLGYRLDPVDCFTIAWRPEEDALSRAANRLAKASPSPEPLSVVSCALAPAPRSPVDVEAENRMSAVFARIEKRCALLRGQTAVTEPFGSGWLRHYNGLDARLEAFGGAVVLHRFRSGEIIDLGRVPDWERENAPVPEACRGAA